MKRQVKAVKETELRAIYREAFKDDDTNFEDKLFKYCKEYIYSAEYGGETAAMLFALPCRLVSESGESKAVYIYAAATLEKYRGRGIMSALIEELQKNTDTFLFLKPADVGLVEFYKRLGFKKISATSSSGAHILPAGGFEQLVSCGVTPVQGAYTAMYYFKNKLKFNSLCFEYIME